MCSPMIFNIIAIVRLIALRSKVGSGADANCLSAAMLMATAALLLVGLMMLMGRG